MFWDNFAVYILYWVYLYYKYSKIKPSNTSSIIIYSHIVIVNSFFSNYLTTTYWNVLFLSTIIIENDLIKIWIEKFEFIYLFCCKFCSKLLYYLVVIFFSLWLCTFSLAVSVGAALLLPISILSNEILTLYPASFYVQWLNHSLIHGEIFIGS